MIKKFCSSVLAVAIVMGSGVVASAAEPTDPYTIKDIENHWAFDSVADLMYAGVLSGYEDHTFRPENKVSRAEFLTALFRTAVVLEEEVTVDDYGFASEWAYREELLEEYAASNLAAPYQDLNGHWSKNAVAWVKQYVENIQPGLFAKVFPGNTFDPAKPITREEAAVISSAFLQLPVEDKPLAFTDVAGGYKYQNEIKSLVNNGVVSGYPDNTFRPQDPVTRAATAVILNKVIDDLNYRVNFFDTKEYITAPAGTADVDYVPTFLPLDAVLEETYEPQTEQEKQYYAIYQSVRFDEKTYWQEESITSDVMGDGYEYGTPEYNAEVDKRIAALHEELASAKAEIGYLNAEERAEVFKSLKDTDFWNQAGVYYYLAQYFPDEYDYAEHLQKAVAAYDIEKSGADELFYLYNQLSWINVDNGDKAKVIEYVNKALELYETHNADQLTTIEHSRYFLHGASALEQVGAYTEAINLLDQYLAQDEFDMSEEVEFERAVLQYLNGTDKNEVVSVLKDLMNSLDLQDEFDQYQKKNIMWALKSIARGDK